MIYVTLMAESCPIYDWVMPELCDKYSGQNTFPHNYSHVCHDSFFHLTMLFSNTVDGTQLRIIRAIKPLRWFKIVRCCSVLQCIAVYCSVLQCIAVYCSVLQCIAVCCSVLQCVSAWSSVLLRGAVWCRLVQCGAVWCSMVQCGIVWCSVLSCGAVRCNVVQRGATWCNAVQCGAVWCNMVQYVAVRCSVLSIVRCLLAWLREKRYTNTCEKRYTVMIYVKSYVRKEFYAYKKGYCKVDWLYCKSKCCSIVKR